jgi:hypothetical protein
LVAGTDVSIDLDRLKSAFDSAVEAALPGVDYSALYTAKVIVQNADGTLDLQPTSSKIPSQKNIPIWLGFPGTVQVPAGSQVLMGWQNSDPSIPYAALWLAGAPTSAPMAARSGDPVQVSIPAGTVVVRVTPGPPVAGVLNPVAIDLTGTITSGSTITGIS